MKIVHVDEIFHPAYGYHTTPLAKFQRRQGHEVTIVSVDKRWLHPIYKQFGDDGSTMDLADSKYEKENNVKIVRVPAKGYFMNRLIYEDVIFRIVEQEQPDIVYVHYAETITAMRFLIRRKKYPIILDSHMLQMASKNRFANVFTWGYRLLFTPIIKREKYDVIRTQEDDYIINKLGIPKKQAPFVSFGTDTHLFDISNEVRGAFRRRYGISEDAFVIVYTGKLTPAKGGMFFAETIKERFACNKDIVFVIVGEPQKDEYGKKVEEVIKNSDNRVLCFPTQRYDELPQFYQAADLSIFPKQCSLSFYDAQACGLPVLSEDNNVNVDRCSHGNGMNFIGGNIGDFRAKIEYLANMSNEEYDGMRKAAVRFIHEGYDYKKITEDYNVYINRAIERFSKKKKGK